jgi:putative copper export protein
VWRAPPVAAPVSFGIGVAVGAGAATFVLLAGDRVHGGLGAGLDGSALHAVSTSRPGALTIGAIACLLVGAVLVAVRRPPVALVPLAASGALVALRGHVGTSGDRWATLADAIHLLAAAAWTGALAHLVLVLAAAAALGSAASVPVRRYAELALPTVLVVLGTGVLTALAEFRDLSSVLETGYGRTLLVKSALVLVALGLALASRLFALRANPDVDVPLVRGLALPELGVLAAVLAAAGLLANLAPPRSAAPTAADRAARQPVTVTNATSRGTRVESALGQAAGSTAAPGVATVREKVWKSLSQNRKTVPRGMLGRTSEKRPFASGQRAKTGRRTPFGPRTPTRRPR